jgi:hypothetical protein
MGQTSQEDFLRPAAVPEQWTDIQKYQEKRPPRSLGSFSFENNHSLQELFGVQSVQLD